jgi:hypothetical protein
MIAMLSFAHDFEVDGIYYNITSSAEPYTVEVTNKSGTRYTGAVTIPTSVTYDGTTYKVTRIGESAFVNCSGLTSVTIPNSVTSIGEKAFANCSGLNRISLPSSVTSIDDKVFYGCSSLTSITIPLGVTEIGYQMFYKCSELRSITIPSSVTIISSEAFYGCLSLTSITIPSSVKQIGSGVFTGCAYLKNITIGGNVKYVGGDLFGSTSTIPSTMKIYVDKNSISLLSLWSIKLYSKVTGEANCSDYLYDINTREKINLFEATASSIKLTLPNPKNYTITSQLVTFGGKTFESPCKVMGLSPNTYATGLSMTIKYKDDEGYNYTLTKKETVMTQKLTLTTEQPKVVSLGNVIVSAKANVDDEEENVGFEWRRTDWTDDFKVEHGNSKRV